MNNQCERGPTEGQHIYLNDTNKQKKNINSRQRK